MTSTLVQSSVDTRDKVIAILRQQAEIARSSHATALYLFGSAARGELTTDSDVDVFIDYDRNEAPTLIDLGRLERQLALVLNRRVDLTTRDGLHPQLRADIEAEAVRVF